MKQRFVPGILLIFLFLSLAIGSFLANIYSSLDVKKAESTERPVIRESTEDVSIKIDDTIILEQEFSKCKHVVIAPFKDKQDLLGKRISEIKQQYTMKNGYQVSYAQNTLIIHQIIDDWCSVDKEKCRLKEYKGRVGVFQGPNTENDALMRVTEIKIESLPDHIRQAIEKGEYEFENMERLNDALENLDEYL
ncbi:MAG: hypothetical protein GX808_04825 [Syntrophomonadaceae bacterium]|nr:hypothetical protein [Syntrophomonadaceae bacterium]